ncbi:Pentatricopeptide repeat-containing protein, mitochondrial [Ananas comosus]|uniref:Pentatricopeptide repeat-containing protein, mitochondrial n=1 Tax=Ananas comosus TaxID=4615 RepID=A0A199UGC5_ANACO|nr:Pentatricopeptide repeat-containing protein, mitochondrial [Ananas comosus]
MHKWNLRPDCFALAAVAKSAAALRNNVFGRSLHGFAAKEGYAKEVAVEKALMDMYSRFGLLSESYKVFDEMGRRDSVAWNIMLTGFAHEGLSEKAMGLFYSMHVCGVEGIKPTAVTIAVILPVCAKLKLLKPGLSVHGLAIKIGLDSDTLVGNALVSMHAKCGRVLEDAHRVFLLIGCKDVVSWNSIISGFLENGFYEEAFDLFSHMVSMRFLPNYATIANVLPICAFVEDGSHAGLTDAGQKLFESIKEVHCIEPTMEHYSCMVDILARSGHIREAYEFILKMPCEANASVWGPLLGACKTHKEVEIGRLVAKRLFEIEGENIGNYVVMSNIYAANERWDGVGEVRRMMKSKYLKKPAGCSWIEVEKSRHLFVAGSSQMLSLSNATKSIQLHLEDV